MGRLGCDRGQFDQYRQICGPSDGRKLRKGEKSEPAGSSGRFAAGRAIRKSIFATESSYFSSLEVPKVTRSALSVSTTTKRSVAIGPFRHAPRRAVSFEVSETGFAALRERAVPFKHVGLMQLMELPNKFGAVCADIRCGPCCTAFVSKTRGHSRVRWRSGHASGSPSMRISLHDHIPTSLYYVH